MQANLLPSHYYSLDFSSRYSSLTGFIWLTVIPQTAIGYPQPWRRTELEGCQLSLGCQNTQGHWLIMISFHDNRDQCLSMLSETQECTTKRSYFGLKEVNLLVLGRSLREVRISIQYDDLISNTGLITKLLFVSHLFKHNRYVHKECELFYLRLWFHLQGWSYRHVKNKNVSLFVSFFTTIIYLINASGK